MIANFGAELLFIAMLALTPTAGNMFVLFAAFFGIGETVVHTIFSIVVACAFSGPMGEKELYTPLASPLPGARFCPSAYSACIGS